MNYYLSFCFFISLFPWVSFGVLSGDIQPYSFILCSLAILFYLQNFNFPQILLALISLFSILITLIDSESSFLSFRGIVNYTSPLVYFSIFIISVKKLGEERVFLIVEKAVLIWLLAALFQFFYPHILDIFLSGRSSVGRGVTSFSPEPTFFGMHSVMLFALITQFKTISKRKKFILCLLLAVSVVVLAKSAMAIIYLFSFILLIFLYNFTVWRLFLFSLGGVFSIFVFMHFFNDSRFYNVFYNIIAANAFYTDESLNDRLRAIVFSFYGAFDNQLIPAGYHSFGEVSARYRQLFGGFFWAGKDLNRIMSGLGGMVYELGVFSTLYLVFVFMIFCRKFSVMNIGYCMWYLLLILSAVTFSIPALTYFISLVYMNNRSAR